MRTKAIVIRKMQTGEYDQIVTLYSEDFGTMRAMARGVCKPTSVQSMHLELLNEVEFEVIHGKALPIISSAVVLEQYRAVKDSLPKLAGALFFTEVLDKIAFENEKDSNLWNFLKAMLAEFNSADSDKVLSVFRKNQADFLKVLGYAPQIDKCVACSKDAFGGSERMVALSTELGGVICSGCFLSGGRGIMIDKSDLGYLVGASNLPVSASRHSALDTFFEYTVGRKINSLAFFYQVINA